MKKSLLMKTMLLLWALIVGSSSVWADDEPQWSYTVVNGDASKLNTTDKTFTVDDSHVWSYEGTTVAAGSPVVSVAKSTNYGLKFGNSGSAYFSPVILSTSVFSDKAITKVSLYLKHNGKKVGNLTVKQGNTTIGTVTTDNTSDWINVVTSSETKKGAGGTLEIKYEVAQALLINKIEVWYEDLGTATTTTIDASGINNTDVYISTEAGSLTATVKDNENNSVEGASVTWSGDNDDVATINASTGAVTLVAAGTVTFTATYAGEKDSYSSSSATYEMTVIDGTPKTGAWVLTALSDLTEDDVFVIVGENGSTYALSNDNGTSGAPEAVEVTIANNEITSDVSNNIKWNISGNATDGYTFYPNGTTETWLYCNTTASSSSNNNMRVGTGERKVFALSGDNLVTKDSYTARYVSIYNNTDWRGYVNTNSAPSIAFYKYEDSSSKSDPKLSFSPSELNATIGEDFTLPTLNAAEGFNGTVEYSSSDESVAMIEDSGEGTLRLMKEGTTTITATFAGNDDFKPGYAFYTLTVTDNRIATTITQENIVLEVSEVGSLTQLNPVVKDANDNVIPYEFSEFLSIVSFEQLSEDDVISSIDCNTGQITLSGNVGTATLKAYYNGDTTYKPSECTFTITVESVLENIAALTANTVAGTYKVNLTDAVVTYVNGNNAYIQDASGAVAFYKNGHDLTAGDIFNGKATVAYKLNNKTPQITSIEDVTPTAGEAPAPTIVAAADWNYTFNEVLSQYFTITGATLTQGGTKYYVQLNGESVQLYKVGSSISSLDLKKTYTITGFPTFYNTTKELQIFVDPEVEPSVAVSPDKVNAYAAGVNGTVAITYEKLEISDAEDFKVQFYDSEENALQETPDWVEAVVAKDNGNYFVSYTIGENTDLKSRTAYFKVYAMDNETPIYSNLVTVKQKGAPINPAVAGIGAFVKVTSTDDITAGNYLIVYENGENSGVAFDGSLKTLDVNNSVIAVDIVEGKIPAIASTVAATFAIKPVSGTMQSASGKFIGKESNSNGLDTSDDEDFTNTFEIDAYGNVVITAEVGCTLRYNKASDQNRFRYYKSGQQSIQLYKYDETADAFAVVKLAEACHNSENIYYGTYSNANAFIVPEGLTVAEVGIVDNKLYVEEYATGTVVPANTGVMVSSTTAGVHSVDLTSDAGTSVLDDDNRLRATGNEGISADDMAAADANCKFYRLTMHNGTDLGFYWGAAEGAAFAVAANKAYLAVPKTAGARIQGFSLDGDTVTGISQIENEKSKVENYFDLQGRSIANPAKGLYIKNGKKVVIR